MKRVKQKFPTIFLLLYCANNYTGVRWHTAQYLYSIRGRAYTFFNLSEIRNKKRLEIITKHGLTLEQYWVNYGTEITDEINAMETNMPLIYRGIRFKSELYSHLNYYVKKLEPEIIKRKTPNSLTEYSLIQRKCREIDDSLCYWKEQLNS